MCNPPLQMTATCLRMNLSLRTLGHALGQMEFFIPMWVRPLMATPADLMSTAIIVHGTIAVRHPEFPRRLLRVLAFNILQSCFLYGHEVGRLSLSKVFLGTRPCIRVARVGGPHTILSVVFAHG